MKTLDKNLVRFNHTNWMIAKFEVIEKIIPTLPHNLKWLWLPFVAKFYSKVLKYLRSNWARPYKFLQLKKMWNTFNKILYFIDVYQIDNPLHFCTIFLYEKYTRKIKSKVDWKKSLSFTCPSKELEKANTEFL